MRTSWTLWAALPMLVLATACSTTSREPREQMALGQRSVETAANSPTVVQAAPVELQMARDKLAAAQRELANRNYDQARRLAEEADVDARLAQAKASAQRSERAYSELQGSIQQLRDEIARGGAK